MKFGYLQGALMGPDSAGSRDERLYPKGERCWGKGGNRKSVVIRQNVAQVTGGLHDSQVDGRRRRQAEDGLLKGQVEHRDTERAE